jgi:F-type H+-transporting ATPase subunit b
MVVRRRFAAVPEMPSAEARAMSDPHSAVQTTAVVGHDAGHKGAFPPFDATHYPSSILWLAVTFGVLYYLVLRKLGPALASVVEGRRERIAADFAAAERLKEESEAAAANYERAIADARRKAAVLQAESRAALNADIDARRAAAEAALAERLAAAEARLGAVRTTALGEVAGIATTLTGDIVAALSGRPVTGDEATSAVAAVR